MDGFDGDDALTCRQGNDILGATAATTCLAAKVLTPSTAVWETIF
ncbi:MULTISPECIES: hypothetical protein [Microcoleus]